MAAYVSRKRGLLFPVLLGLILFISLFPIYWIVVTALKPSIENISPIPFLLPHRPSLENFASLLAGGYARNLLNSVFVTGASTLLSLALALLAAYALCRHRFPLRLNYAFLVWIILAKMLPPVVLAVPLYETFMRMKLLNSLWGLVLVYQVYTLPYCIWMLFGFVKSLPLEFEESAEIDGASRLQVLSRIVVPLVRTGIVATAIFTVIVAWDEFLFAVLFIRSPELLTLPLVIVNFIGEFETLWGQLMAVGLLAALPVLVFSRLVYRHMSSAYALGLK
ncbi:MAG TPA: carbohydrate ABC transporter permease [Rectinemataceae bacterium]|nr:carbohydrate ABC transporter permease [Rectinemataceae bacterium]